MEWAQNCDHWRALATLGSIVVDGMPLRRQRKNWKMNLKIDLRDSPSCKDGRCIEVAQDYDQWRASVRLNLRVCC
jgi:hypothetical protein